MRRWLVLVAMFVGTGCALPEQSMAQSGWFPVFRDDFNGTILDPGKWRIFTEGQVPGDNGSYFVADGWLSLRSTPGLPSIVTVSGLVPTSGDLCFRFGFRYGDTTRLGTRIGVTSLGGDDPAYYGLHRDATVKTGICTAPTGLYSGGPESACVRFEGDPPSYHVAELVFTADEVMGFIDGVQRMSSPFLGTRPNAVFFGWGANFLFTEFDVDFVEVLVRDGPVRVEALTWSRLRSQYR